MEMWPNGNGTTPKPVKESPVHDSTQMLISELRADVISLFETVDKRLDRIQAQLSRLIEQKGNK